MSQGGLAWACAAILLLPIASCSRGDDSPKRSGSSGADQQTFWRKPLQKGAELSLRLERYNDPDGPGSGALLTLGIDGTVKVSDWLVSQTALEFMSSVDSAAAEEVLSKCANGIAQLGNGEDQGVYINHVSSYELVITNGGESHQTFFPGLVLHGKQLGFADDSSASLWSETMVWNAMIDEIARLVVKK